MRHFARLSIALAFAFGLAGAAFAQVPSTVPPYNTDLGALITNSLRVAGTVTTAAQTNLDKNGAVCTFNQTASSGSPSTTFSIQGYDAATASWLTYITSGAITDTTTTAIAVYPGMATSPLSGMTCISVHLPRVWRVSQTIAGTSGPATTSKIGCNMLR